MLLDRFVFLENTMVEIVMLYSIILIATILYYKDSCCKEDILILKTGGLDQDCSINLFYFSGHICSILFEGHPEPRY